MRDSVVSIEHCYIPEQLTASWQYSHWHGRRDYLANSSTSSAFRSIYDARSWPLAANVSQITREGGAQQRQRFTSGYRKHSDCSSYFTLTQEEATPRFNADLNIDVWTPLAEHFDTFKTHVKVVPVAAILNWVALKSVMSRTWRKRKTLRDASLSLVGSVSCSFSLDSYV